MAPKSTLAVGALLGAAVALGACSSGGDDDGSSPTTDARSGCPVAVAVVEDAVGHPVEVRRRPAGPGSCAYVGTGEHAGARVEVAVRDLADEPYENVLAGVERRSGPTGPLPDGLVDGADRGWRTAVGRAVQVGAAEGDDLVVVAVVDPLLATADAEEVAGRLAGEALDG